MTWEDALTLWCAFFIIGFCSACGDYNELPEPDGMTVLDRQNCDLALDPEPLLLGPVSKAARLWNEALPGCNVRVEVGGAPVVLSEDIDQEQGLVGDYHGSLGVTRVDTWSPATRLEETADSYAGRSYPLWNVSVIYVEQQEDLLYTVTHEIGHALGGDHMKRGLMGPWERVQKHAPVEIDGLAIESVCRATACGVEREAE